MNPTLSALFPLASKSCHDVNPPSLPEVEAKTISTASTASGKAKRGVMNNTEAEFALYLLALKQKGEILRYEFEGITLRWADMKYTPDFVVFDTSEIHCLHSGPKAVRLKLIEVKGGHIWDRDIVRFKGARAYWPEFAFEMHQKQKTGWKRIH
jgi:hypothetical protein